MTSRHLFPALTSGGGAGGLEVTEPHTISFTASPETENPIDTTNGEITATLPADADLEGGERVSFYDIKGSPTPASNQTGFGNNRLVIQENTGQTILGVTDGLVLDIDHETVVLSYDKANLRWNISGGTFSAGLVLNELGITDDVTLTQGLVSYQANPGERILAEYPVEVVLPGQATEGDQIKVRALDKVTFSSSELVNGANTSLVDEVPYLEEGVITFFYTATEGWVGDADLRNEAVEVTQLSYQSDNDTNGVFYWIGTSGNTTAFSNPHPGEITVSLIDVLSDDPANEGGFSTDRSDTNFHTKDTPNSWLKVDLGLYRSLKVSYYSYQSRHNTSLFMPRTWELQGSNNDVDWVTLDSQTNNTTLSGNGEWVSLPVTISTHYRYIRFILTGNDSGGEWYLTGSRWELYGELKEGGTTTLFPGKFKGTGTPGAIIYNYPSITDLLTGDGDKLIANDGSEVAVGDGLSLTSGTISTEPFTITWIEKSAGGAIPLNGGDRIIADSDGTEQDLQLPDTPGDHNSILVYGKSSGSEVSSSKLNSSPVTIKQGLTYRFVYVFGDDVWLLAEFGGGTQRIQTQVTQNSFTLSSSDHNKQYFVDGTIDVTLPDSSVMGTEVIETSFVKRGGEFIRFIENSGVSVQALGRYQYNKFSKVRVQFFSTLGGTNNVYYLEGKLDNFRVNVCNKSNPSNYIAATVSQILLDYGAAYNSVTFCNNSNPSSYVTSITSQLLLDYDAAYNSVTFCNNSNPSNYISAT